MNHDIIGVTVSVWLFFALFITGKRIINNKENWKDGVWYIAVYSVMLLIYWSIKPNLTVAIKDFSDLLIGGQNIGLMSILSFVVCATSIIFVIWYFLDKVVVKPAAGHERFWLAIVTAAVGLSVVYAFLSDKGVKGILTSYNDLLVAYIAGLTVIAAFVFVKYKDAIQNAVAVPIGAIIASILFALAFHNRFGINLMEKVTQAGEAGWAGPLTIVIIGITFSTILHKSVEFRKRLAYKVVFTMLCILVINAIYISLAFISGGTNKQTKSATHTKNKLTVSICEDKKRASMSREFSGLTFNQAKYISEHPDQYDIESKEKALASVTEHEKQFQLIDKDCQPLESSDKIDWNPFKNGVSDVISAGVSAKKWGEEEYRKWVPSSVSVNKKQTSAIKQYGRGTYQFTLAKNEISDWIDVGPDDLFFNLKSDGDLILTYSDGTVYKMWEPGPLPKKRARFRLQSLDDQVVTMNVF